MASKGSTITYPSDPFQHMVADEAPLRQIAFDETYPYDDRTADYKLQQAKCYWGLWLFGLTINRLKYGLKVEGRRNYLRNRKLFKDGALTVSNHVYRWDMLCVIDSVRYHRFRIPAYNKHFLGNDNWFLRSIGCIPLPDTPGGARKFNEAFDKFHEEGKWIHIFPESCRWEWYDYVRPFKIGAFNMAYRYGLPVIPLMITFRERKGLYRLFGKKDVPCATIHVGTPIVTDRTANRKIETARLRDEAHAQMVAMAGIKDNPWPSHID